MTMESLPTEVLSHILKYLSPIDRLRSEQVCRKWRDASRCTWIDIQTLYIIQPNDPNYYYRFKDCTESHELVEKEDNRLFIGSDCPKIIGCLLSRVGCFINKLIFNYRWSKNNRLILSEVNIHCHNLKIFEIGPVDESDDEELLPILLKLNKELHSVRCHNSRNFIEALPLKNWRSLRLGSSTSSDEGKIVSLIEHSEALEEFEAREFTTRIVEILLTRRNLKSLYFNTIHGGSFEMIFHVPLLNRLTNFNVVGGRLDWHMLGNLLQHCCQLKRLMIHDFRTDIPAMFDFLKTIIFFPVLEQLELLGVPIRDDMLIYLTKVKNLSFSDNRNRITNEGVLQLIQKSEVLENLNIENTNVTREMFEQLVKEMSDCHKHLNVMIPYEIFNEVSEICANSKIRVIKDIQCFRYCIDCSILGI